jgi:hypothetical protein
MAAGRPVKEINWEVVEKLIECNCSGPEIAGKFRVDTDTFYRRFKIEYGANFGEYRVGPQSAGLADLKAMLRAKALSNKAPGNATLLMFLARCELGMKEPELAQTVAPRQDEIDQEHLIMNLKHEIAELKANANKPETG